MSGTHVLSDVPACLCHNAGYSLLKPWNCIACLLSVLLNIVNNTFIICCITLYIHDLIWSRRAFIVKLIFIIYPSGRFFGGFFLKGWHPRYFHRSRKNKIKPYIVMWKQCPAKLWFPPSLPLPAVSTLFPSLRLCPVKWYRSHILLKQPCLIILLLSEATGEAVVCLSVKASSHWGVRSCQISANSDIQSSSKIPAKNLNSV